tara:strand:- start:28 stop:819 length:792 start_codon:yes stop_codon:yes gene_type:complete
MNKINAYTNFLYQNTLIFVTVKLKLVIFNFYDLFRKRKLLNLSEDEKELKRNGYLLSNFKINISKLNSFIEEKFKSNISGKNHWTRKDLSPEDFEELLDLLNKDNPFSKYVYSYFGFRPIMESAELLNSITKKDFKKSQLIHKDYDSNKMLKFFIYLSDVNDIDSGPLTIVKNNKLLTFFYPIHKSLKWEKENIRKKNIKFKEVYGPEGTNFFLDTSRNFHVGSRCLNNKTRKCLIISFRSKFRIRGNGKNVGSNYLLEYNNS